jgi:hypothetical protein
MQGSVGCQLVDQHTHYGVSEGNEGEKKAIRVLKEMMAKKYPNLMKDININIQEAHKLQVG